MSFLTAVWDVLLELSAWLLLGTAIAGALHVLLPHGFVERQLAGRAGILKAVLLGIPLPLCSCSVIPAGLGLRRDGAGRGASVGFLIATPQTGVDSILVSAAFLGWPFAVVKVAAALVTGIAGGVLTDLTPAGPEDLGKPAGHHHSHGWRGGVEHGVDLIRMIWRWLVFGVLLSAVITVLIPPAAFESLAGQGLIISFLAALLVSLPLYVCATASVPIAAALVAAGMPTGAAMVFLMAGPATNLATLGAVKRAFGLPVAGVYLGTLITGSVLFGLGYEAVFGDLVVVAEHVHEHASLVQILSAVALLGLLAWFAVEDVRSWLTPAPQQAVELDVVGMTCNGCAGRLERTLQGADGVVAARVDLDDARAYVESALPAESLRELIRAAGFESPSSPGQTR